MSRFKFFIVFLDYDLLQKVIMWEKKYVKRVKKIMWSCFSDNMLNLELLKVTEAATRGDV